MLPIRPTVSRIRPKVFCASVQSVTDPSQMFYIVFEIQETPEPELEPVTGTGVNRNRLNRIRDS